MSVNGEAGRLRALPAQVLDTPSGVIVKRGRGELLAQGPQARELVMVILRAGAGAGFVLDELLESMPASVRPAVGELIEALAVRRMLVAGDGQTDRTAGSETPLDVFHWSFGATTAAVSDRLDAAPIAVLGLNSISRQLAVSLARGGAGRVEIVDYALLRSLREFGEAEEPELERWPDELAEPVAYADWAARVGDPDAEPLGCLVATADFGGLQQMRPWNEHCVETRIPFLAVVLQDMVGYVGPLVIPGETACFECLRARQNSHLADPETERAAEREAFAGQHVAAVHPAMASILGTSPRSS